MTKSKYLLFLFLKYFWCFIIINILTYQNLTAQTTPEKHKIAKSVLDTLFESSISVHEKFDQFQTYNPQLDIYSDKIAIGYARQGITFSNKTNDPFIKGYMLSNLGLFYCNTGVYDSSIIYIENSLSHFEEAKRYRKKAEMHGLLRYVYGQASDFESALKHCYHALGLYEKIGDEEGVGATYNDIAGTLISTNKYEEALSFAKKGRDILKKQDNLFELVMTTEKIAICHKELGDLKKALIILNEAIDLASSGSIPLGIEYLSQLYITRSNLHTSLEKYDLVLKDFELTRNLYAEFPDHLYLNTVDMNEANFYLEIKEYKKAKTIFLDLFHKIEIDIIPPDYVYDGLATSYAGLNQFDSAYHFLRAYEKVSSEEKSHESKLKMEELKTQYETEQKEEQIALQERQITLQERLQNLSYGILGLFGILLLGLVYAFQKNKSKNQKLALLNDTLSIKNKENELLLKEIHHRVKNNLQTISSLLNLQSNSITDQNAFDAVQESRNRVASMALIHQKLYQGENLAAIEMRDYFETIGNAIISSFGEKAKHVELDIDMLEIELDVDTAIPIGLITNELITNSLKYAFDKKENGKISISMKKQNDNLIQLSITDNGINDSTSISEDGTGFGSLLIQLLTTQLGGKIEKSTAHGTSSIIQFPWKKDLAA